MMFLNEHEVQEARRFFDDDDTPNLRAGAEALAALVAWTNSNSDGWPYWSKPSRAAQRLMTTLHDARQPWYRGSEVKDISPAMLAAVLRPIKAFLTREGVSHDVLQPR
jgi:hypothetical protein